MPRFNFSEPPTDERYPGWVCAIILIVGAAAFWAGLVFALSFMMPASARQVPFSMPPPEMTLTEEQMDRSRETYVPLAKIAEHCGSRMPLRGYNGQIIARPEIIACYIRDEDRIYLPADWASKAELKMLRIHEHAHRVYNWVHKCGDGREPRC